MGVDFNLTGLLEFKTAFPISSAIFPVWDSANFVGVIIMAVSWRGKLANCQCHAFSYQTLGQGRLKRTVRYLFLQSIDSIVQ